MKTFSKLMLTASMLSLTTLAFADALGEKNLNYVSGGMNTGFHSNEKSIETVIDNKTVKSGQGSVNGALEAEAALKISEKINFLLGVGVGFEQKTYEGVRPQSHFQLTSLTGLTYNVTDNFSAGVGIKNYYGEKEATRLGAVSAILRYKLKRDRSDTSGLTLNLEVEKNTDNAGFGIKTGVSAAAF